MRFVERAAAELAEQLEPYRVDLVVSVATMGIPLAIEVTKALGLDDYVILQKTPKLHLRDAITEPVKSITTGTPQRLLFDAAKVDFVKGKRVALVDDVISTGASMRAALNLLNRVGARAGRHRHAVDRGGDAGAGSSPRTVDLVHALGVIPVFRREPRAAPSRTGTAAGSRTVWHLRPDKGGRRGLGRAQILRCTCQSFSISLRTATAAMSQPPGMAMWMPSLSRASTLWPEVLVR